jgi:hypothetical protein
MEKTLYSDETNECVIVNRNGSKIFRQNPTETTYISFNVNYLPEEKYEWFCDVVGRQIKETIKKVRSETASKFQSNFRKLAGL